MIGSRLRTRRVWMTVSVKSKTLTGGQFSESNLYTGLTATHEQPNATEMMTEAGAVVIVTDVFWFEPVSGSLPAITEKHVVVNGSDRYEVIMVQNQGGQGHRLKVMTRALR